MPLSLPPEIFDLVVEHLCEERATLKICCVVAKSWVPHARRHLFACVEFRLRNSNHGEPDVIATATVAYAWIRAFCNIVNLTVETNALYPRQFSLVPLHALSPTLKSLRLVHDSIPTLEVFSLICSLPSLEDLELEAYGRGETDVYALSPTSPKFTGILSLSRGDGVRFDIWSLLALPSGLHFTAIRAKCLAEDLESITSLVSACCNTLESLTILQSLPGASSISASLDLSKATNLKKVVFNIGRSSVTWIVTALKTIKSMDLQWITLQSQDVGPYRMSRTEKEFLPAEWRDLDHLLVQFWTSHSIRPKFVDASEYFKGLIPTLFPELTRRGLLDIA